MRKINNSFEIRLRCTAKFEDALILRDLKVFLIFVTDTQFTFIVEVCMYRGSDSINPPYNVSLLIIKKTIMWRLSTLQHIIRSLGVLLSIPTVRVTAQWDSIYERAILGRVK